jgi:hypothetical protein
MRTIGLVLVGMIVTLLLASGVAAEQRWQCGGGLTVPLQGSRADREAACRDLTAVHDDPDAPITQEQAARLRQRIEQAEKQYDVDIKVEKLDRQ